MNTASQRSLDQTVELKANSNYVRQLLNDKNIYVKLLQHYTCGAAQLYNIFGFCRNPSKGTYGKIGNIESARDVIEGINRVILDAPRLSNELVVYRGITSPPVRDRSGQIVDMGMASTSIYRYIGIDYTERGGHMLKITIPRNCPLMVLKDISTVLKTGRDEYEIILPFGSTFSEMGVPEVIENNITQYNVIYNCTHDSLTALSEDTVDKFKDVLSDMDRLKAETMAKMKADQAIRMTATLARYQSKEKKGGSKKRKSKKKTKKKTKKNRVTKKKLRQKKSKKRRTKKAC